MSLSQREDNNDEDDDDGDDDDDDDNDEGTEMIGVYVSIITRFSNHRWFIDGS